MAMSPLFRWVGDRALLRTFDGAVADANRAAVACAREVLGAGGGGVEDVVPGARSVLVILRPGAEPTRALTAVLDREGWDTNEKDGGPVVDIPVRYGGDDGADLGDVARETGLTEQHVIEAHSSVEYVVGFLGFSPGFAYLLGMDERLATPRLQTPRARVAPGSIGIGGPYTGIYPRATPGGWRVIGRTDVELFDPERRPPSVLSPGIRVRFILR